MSETKNDVEQILRNGYPVQFPVTGWSMYPFLSNQDMVTVEPVSDYPLKINDIILYRRINGPLVLHRLIDIKDEGFYFCGDNQVLIEGPLQKNQILGVLKEYNHKGKNRKTDSASYKLLSNTWRIIRPIRPIISKTVHGIKKLFKR